MEIGGKLLAFLSAKCVPLPYLHQTFECSVIRSFYFIIPIKKKMKSIVSQILFSYSKTNAPLLWYFFADRMEFSILKVNSLTLLYCINHDEKAFSNVSINFFVAEMIVHSTTAAYRQRNLKAVWCSSWIKKEYFKVFANVVFFYKYSPLITLHANCNSFIFHWV